MEPVEIVEDGVLLRPWREADADGVHRACQDRDIQRWTTVPRPYLSEHAHDFVTRMSAQAWADGSPGRRIRPPTADPVRHLGGR
ncbi:GNAT family N-acetyltransferase [Micromonospora sp. DT4]|uniref:GNAT family N-acetyltransferase n=1 Tax=Micromonospora sp. DT4 TaxID=3393438 RepID=UPI003CE6BF37